MSAGVDVTVVFPGVVATDIRLYGYGTAGKPAGRSDLKEDDIMPVEVCARQIVELLRERKRERVMTRWARMALWLNVHAQDGRQDGARRTQEEERVPVWRAVRRCRCGLRWSTTFRARLRIGADPHRQ
jgi:short-subunit dehydrogenase